ncbi:LytR/AlgR family response regulator transcription factor [Cytobacillus sp. FJAT-54145]|uniref:LytR/AlgR family response regulator transcription factor n=1 Tax=Cytobacillus spartinae TaxID=3299023 RepID=A0ABW6K707_9BACI
MGPKIKLIIAEDNLDAQEIMIRFIHPLKDFEVIGVAENGENLVELVANKKPHLIIADINMPKLNGIDAISACIKIQPELRVIFTTAYPEYAVDAFDLNAIDYVVKPIKKERLYVALEKVKKLILSSYIKRSILTIKMDRVSYFIHLSSIICIEKANRKTIIHTIDQTYETNESLESISEKLADQFFRSHRSFIVNLDYISHITLEGDSYFAHFRNYPHYAHVSKLRVNDLLESIS